MSRAQDTGTAMWLFAYFGYWLEVLLVVAARAMKGSLLVAMRTHRPPPVQQARAPVLALSPSRWVACTPSPCGPTRRAARSLSMRAVRGSEVHDE
jgi:hypothetical protein